MSTSNDRALNNLVWWLFLTPQESRLHGSPADREFLDKPYTPIVVQKGWEPSLVDSVRSQFDYFYTEPTYWVNSSGKQSRSVEVKVALAPLDAEGQTTHDPRPLDERLTISEEYVKRFEYRTDS